MSAECDLGDDDAVAESKAFSLVHEAGTTYVSVAVRLTSHHHPPQHGASLAAHSVLPYEMFDA
jgi:hypothetical protein